MSLRYRTILTALNKYLPETQAIIDRAVLEGFTLPSETTLAYINTLIYVMKADGYWAKRDLILNFAYNDLNCRDFSRINWKNPSGALATEINPFYNLLPFSEQIDNGLWTKVDTTVTTNSTIAPDGTTTAELLTSISGAARVQGSVTIQRQFPTGIEMKYNWSCYAKAGTHNILRIAQGTVPIASFDLTAVTATNLDVGQNATITSVGSGWYRCSVDIENTNTTPAFFYGGAAGTTMYLWGLQATEGFGVKTYQKTEGQYASLQYSIEGFYGGLNWNEVIDSYSFDTGYNPVTDGITYTLDNASMDIITQNNVNTNNYIGSAGGTSINNTLRIGNGGTNSRLNGGTANLNIATNTTTLGYIALNRINSTDMRMVVNSTVLNRTQTSTVINNSNQFLWRYNNQSQGGRYSWFSMGAEVVTEGQLFRTAYNNYLTNIGLTPIA